MGDAKRRRPSKADEPVPPVSADPVEPPGPPGGRGAKQTTSRQGKGGGGPVGNRKAVGHGAPKRNQNARKHGIWSKLVGDGMVDEAIALGELKPQERAALHSLLREVKLLRAARRTDTPLGALNRMWGSVLAELRKVGEEEDGDDFDAALDLLDEREEAGEDPADG